MDTEKLIQQFNKPDVNLVISEWPSLDSKIPHHGVAAFTRETLTTLARDRGMRFVVLSETNRDNAPQVTANGKIAVLRVFNQHKRSLYPAILSWLTRFPKVKHVTVHSEFGAYTGLAHFFLLLPFLLLIKLTGKRITYVAHNVVDNLETFAPYINITNDKYIHHLLSRVISAYYWFLGGIVHQVITLDFQSGKKLMPFIKDDKLAYIPHWVKPRTQVLSKARARTILGIPKNKKVLLSFGFISWYKGSDAIVDLFNAHGTNDFHLILAGGKHIVRQNTAHYQKYFDAFSRSVANRPNITYTGYLPEEKIGLYFAAADLVILPYRGLMGGSGALSWAVGYGKPFLISSPMRPLLANPDIGKVLKTMDMIPNNVSFDLNWEGFRMITRVAQNKMKLKKLEQLSKAMRTVRDIHEVCKTFYNDVYTSRAYENHLGTSLLASLGLGKAS